METKLKQSCLSSKTQKSKNWVCKMSSLLLYNIVFLITLQYIYKNSIHNTESLLKIDQVNML